MKTITSNLNQAQHGVLIALDCLVAFQCCLNLSWGRLIRIFLRMLKHVLIVVLLLLMVIILKAQTPAPTKLQDTSQFIITNEDSHNDNYAKVSIYAKDKQDKSPMLAIVGFRDKENKILANFFTDKAGFAVVNFFDFSHIAFISIDYIGYDAITVPIARLKGKNSIIEVFLKGQDIKHEGIN